MAARTQGAQAPDGRVGRVGIRPIPPELRRFRGLDLAVLWGDLSVGLLVLVTGALLVPRLGLREALLAIVVGSAIGCVPLALVGLAGAREGVPGMVLFRPVLGRRGSYLPSVLNLLQLLGWTAFELWAMGRVANAMSERLFGLDAYPLWLAVVSILCTGLALGGPIRVVRGWLERFGVYVVLAVGAWITYKVLTAGGFGVAWRRPGEGGLPFWLAVDLVIAQPVSWLPLVADYNRFAKRGASAFAGTYAGYLVGNVWFYALGALLVLAVGANPGVVGIGTQIAAVAGGSVVLMALLAGETDEAFANIYSWAISAQNIRPELPQPALILTVAGLGSGLALFMSIATFQVFLLLIGSVFVPLFGVFAADYFVLRGARFGEGEMFGGNGRPSPHVRWLALVPWAAGFALYQWSVPTGPGWWVGGVRTLVHGWLHLPFPLLGSSLGASLPSFAVAFGLSLVLLRRRRYSSS